jgi:hypothetical protein
VNPRRDTVRSILHHDAAPSLLSAGYRLDGTVV